ncbi:hypothetical protein [Bacillus cereus]|uniref:hypothetical protein n=1 Tax=Bacillus cereus TaxID=1396 RepID=UPI000BF2EE09|nr:hypothetical protein [Bacillus cereus]PES11095.1 hypothetical protein CN494_22585 [Bacillus cereus]PFA14370.1 hypothetical protein CN377_10755 [Bacillus cereus]PFC37672.1 hypothetical protein CN310_13815 [Bacillus cereus]PFS81146.1 hypothetical protein COK49_11070 [Bacillus cereus]PGS17387.1 hypothetical protein COC51_05610 [Bacillus cereus]
MRNSGIFNPTEILEIYGLVQFSDTYLCTINPAIKMTYKTSFSKKKGEKLVSNRNLFIRVLRKEDFLDLTFELVNIHTYGAPLYLCRSNAGEPALLIVHFPSQHIVEEVFDENKDIQTPVKAMLSGPSRLVFKLPDDEDTWALTMETLLNWKDYKSVVPDPIKRDPLWPAAPPFSLPDPKIFEGKTSLEIPTGLYISPDESGNWYNIIQSEGQNGRFVLWHTQLGEKQKENEYFIREGGATHFITTSNHPIPFNSSLTQNELKEIVQLTTDFSMPRLPTGMSIEDWKNSLEAQNLPLEYIPSPIMIRRLMLSSAGAWANFEAVWNYPTLLNDTLGYKGGLSLEQWQHIMTQGRDQFVKTVKKAFLCDTGHAVSIVTITERQFESYDIPNGQNMKGAKAVLRKYSYIEVREPVKNYETLASVYKYNRREIPFKWIKITTRTTPKLSRENKINVILPCTIEEDDKPFWPTKSGKDKPFHFKMIAEDWDGNIVSFERPLLCVPIATCMPTEEQIVTEYNKSIFRLVQLNHQPIAFANTDSNSTGKTTLETATVTFRAQLVEGEKKEELKKLKLPFFQPSFLPEVESAEVNIPAAEQVTGRKLEQKSIEFEKTYLDHGFNSNVNKAEVFMRLAPSLTKLELSLPTEKAGGLITPNSTIEGLSRALGPVANPSDIISGEFDPSTLFGHAKFLGGITLQDILPKKVKIDLLKIKELESVLDPDQLITKLDDPNFKLESPMLTNRRLPNNAIETRYLWKPNIENWGDTAGFFRFLAKRGDTTFEHDAQLSINVQMITTPNGSPPTYLVLGKLKEFALEFVEAMLLKFDELRFTADNGKKMDVSAEGLDLVFKGPLEFVETLKNIIPANGFSDPPFLNVTATGITAGFTLGIPAFGVGIFNLQNINLSAALSLPFVDQPVGVKFAISERHKPFNVSVSGFAGGGFFSLALSAKGIEAIEASIEFGGNISLNLGVATGGVYVMAGIYYGMIGKEVNLTGYLRCGGNLSVLGLVSVTVEFYLGLTYRKKENNHVEVWGQATLTVGVKVAFFSKSVSLTVERRFAGAAGDPTFAQIMGPEYEGDYPYEWEKYCMAFA